MVSIVYASHVLGETVHLNGQQQVRHEGILLVVAAQLNRNEYFVERMLKLDMHVKWDLLQSTQYRLPSAANLFKFGVTFSPCGISP